MLIALLSYFQRSG